MMHMAVVMTVLGVVSAGGFAVVGVFVHSVHFTRLRCATHCKDCESADARARVPAIECLRGHQAPSEVSGQFDTSRA